MTPQGKAYVIARLGDCPDEAALRRVWEGLGVEYQRDPDIAALKDRLKATLGAQLTNQGAG